MHYFGKALLLMLMTHELGSLADIHTDCFFSITETNDLSDYGQVNTQMIIINDEMLNDCKVFFIYMKKKYKNVLIEKEEVSHSIRQS